MCIDKHDWVRRGGGGDCWWCLPFAFWRLLGTGTSRRLLPLPVWSVFVEDLFTGSHKLLSFESAGLPNQTILHHQPRRVTSRAVLPDKQTDSRLLYHYYFFSIGPLERFCSKDDSLVILLHTNTHINHHIGFSIERVQILCTDGTLLFFFAFFRALGLFWTKTHRRKNSSTLFFTCFMGCDSFFSRFFLHVVWFGKPNTDGASTDRIHDDRLWRPRMNVSSFFFLLQLSLLPLW